jgi:hypothetical protein
VSLDGSVSKNRTELGKWNNSFIYPREKVVYLRFFNILYSAHRVSQRINYDNNIIKLRAYSIVSIFSDIFTPNNIHMVISNMSFFIWMLSIVSIRRHHCHYMVHQLQIPPSII